MTRYTALALAFEALRGLAEAIALWRARFVRHRIP